MEGLMLYKLIILYMLDRIDEYTLTTSQITSFIYDRNYTNLFNIHETLNELIDEGFISVSTIRNTQHYKITDHGEEALLYFENRISDSIKQEILEYLKNEKLNIKNESEIYADFFFNDSSEYTVDCVIKERRDTLLEIRLNVPNRGLARAICDSWRSKSTEVYQYLINTLWANPDTDKTDILTSDKAEMLASDKAEMLASDKAEMLVSDKNEIAGSEKNELSSQSKKSKTEKNDDKPEK